MWSDTHAIFSDLITYWNCTIDGMLENPPGEAWQRYCQQVHLSLANEWLQNRPSGYVLKTDLFEEAISAQGLWEYLAREGDVPLGMDLSERAAQLASCRLGQAKQRPLHTDGHFPRLSPRALVADVRQLPFADNSLACIFSNSTLDHFRDECDIYRSLSEFYRALQPGGFALVTFDNPMNPVIALRNRFPRLRSLGGVPYYVGPTISPQSARRAMIAANFELRRVSSVIHAPRLPFILLSRTVKALNNREESVLLRLMCSFEHLGKLSTRYLTGYFIALLGVKPTSHGRKEL